MKKRILIVGMVLTLLTVLAMPMTVFADTKTTTLTGNPSGAIETTLTGDITDWALSLGGNTDTISMNIKCSVDNWTVDVYDNLDSSKPSGTEGKMAEWDGSNYVTTDGHVLQTAMEVKSSLTDTYVTLSGTVQQIETDVATPDTGTNYTITMSQSVDYGDEKLPTPNVYRIVITFVSSTPF